MTEQTTLLENDIARLSENIAEQYAIDAVSYTHLTLPTKLDV